MSAQMVAQFLVAGFGIATILASFAANYYSGQEDKAKISHLSSLVTILQRDFDANTKKIFGALDIAEDKWIEVDLDGYPAGVADYALLLFRSSGRAIVGKVRMKGSKESVPFSTVANSNVPVAVPGLWDRGEARYVPVTKIEFSVTRKADPEAALSILTAGFIDARGQDLGLH